VHLAGIRPGQLYGYRMSGPYAPELGHRFDPEKILLDPYARAISTKNYQRSAAAQIRRQYRSRREKRRRRSQRLRLGRMIVLSIIRFPVLCCMKCTLADSHETQTRDVTEEKRGTYAGLIEKDSIPEGLWVSLQSS
jgi:pullulanase/glycogen debranching enzyme